MGGRASGTNAVTPVLTQAVVKVFYDTGILWRSWYFTINVFINRGYRRFFCSLLFRHNALFIVPYRFAQSYWVRYNYRDLHVFSPMHHNLCEAGGMKIEPLANTYPEYISINRYRSASFPYHLGFYCHKFSAIWCYYHRCSRHWCENYSLHNGYPSLRRMFLFSPVLQSSSSRLLVTQTVHRFCCSAEVSRGFECHSLIIRNKKII